MLATGTKVLTPFAVATLKEISTGSDGRMVARVTRDCDGAEQHYDVECLTDYRVYNVGEIVRVFDKRGSEIVCDGYGEIVHRSNCGHRRHAYEIRMDGDETNTRWANLFTMRTLGGPVGSYPAWDNLTETTLPY